MLSFNIPYYNDIQNDAQNSTFTFGKESFNTYNKKFQDNSKNKDNNHILDITTSNIIINLSKPTMLFLQGLFICCLVLTLKSKFITIPESNQSTNIQENIFENENTKADFCK